MGEQLHKLYGLDHLRALAITMVFFCHYQEDIFGHPRWLSHAWFGWTGVDLFFVLSGFLISSQLFVAISKGRGVDYREFLIKRVFRILPAFYAVVGLYFLVPMFREEPTLPELSRLLTFTHNINLDVSKHGSFAQAWSLCVEEHFYLAFPLALLLLHRFRMLRLGGWLIFFIICGAVALREYCYVHQYLPVMANGNKADWGRFLYYPTYNRLDGLLIGVSIAAIHVFSPPLWQQLSRYGNMMFAFSISILGVAYLACAHPTYNIGTVGFLIIDIGYGCLVISALSPSCFLYRFRWKVTEVIAMLSYGIYLTHRGVIHMTQQATTSIGLDSNSVAVLAICTGASMVFAYGLYRAVERPFMKLRAKVLRRKQPIQPPEVSALPGV